MRVQNARFAMILAIAATAPALAGNASDRSQAVADAEKDYKRTELAIYDALSTDPSPHVAVLAGEIYLDKDDATPTALRPKREQVVARAVENAPDDAFVQWMAASQGTFYGSACGPTKWPETEVANLIRLEPDNAAAWQFGVALARAKSDEAGVDAALSHMAAASRADDHVTDEIGAWTAAAHVHPELIDKTDAYWFDGETDPTPQQKALIAGLERVMFSSHAAKAALETVCKPDAKSDRVWQRLGWCADAGKLLAEKGASLALRKQGLDLLAAIDVHDDEVAKAQRQYDWLEEYDANPTRAHHAWDDSPADTEADWQGATTEIAAIGQRLKRLGLPSSPPEGWTKEVSHEEQASSDSTQKATQLYADYLKALFADMSASGSPEQRMLAALNDRMLTELPAPDGASKAPVALASAETITALADGNAGNLKVQWFVATSGDDRISVDTKAGAIARIEVAEDDNAAAWSLSLPPGGALDEKTAAATLKRMASSTRYDAHLMFPASAMLDALRKRPPPDELVSLWRVTSAQEMTSDTSMKLMALNVAYSSMLALNGVTHACSPPATGALAPSRRDACVAIGRLMVHKATDLLGIGFGEGILRRLDALDAADADRVRHVRWWSETAIGNGENVNAAGYLDELFAGDEIEAFRKTAEGSGKLEPPADWTPARSPFGKQTD